VKLEPVMLENGARYHGDWVNAARDGKGHQKWPDGSEYNGEWKNNRACGKGKLIHADGDIYEGDW